MQGWRSATWSVLKACFRFNFVTHLSYTIFFSFGVWRKHQYLWQHLTCVRCLSQSIKNFQIVFFSCKLIGKKRGVRDNNLPQNISIALKICFLNIQNTSKALSSLPSGDHRGYKLVSWGVHTITLEFLIMIMTGVVSLPRQKAFLNRWNIRCACVLQWWIQHPHDKPPWCMMLITCSWGKLASYVSLN